MKQPRVLAVIPARGGSKRIPNKNVKRFRGKPLIAHAIEQALALSFVDRVIVDTDSPKIARVAKRCGAEVPFLRPASIAGDNAQAIEVVTHLLARLEAEGYVPDYVLILQTTSPLREISDIEKCWSLMRKGGATTVLTVAPTHPRLYHIDGRSYIHLVNGAENMSTNVQAWPQGYVLNGCFAYITHTKTLLKENRIITKKTKAVVCPRWRSVDLDTPEDWVIAEFLAEHKNAINRTLNRFK